MRFALVMSEAGSGLKRNLSMVISVVLVTFISLTFVTVFCFLQQPLYWQSIRFGSPPLAIRSVMIAVAMTPWILATTTVGTAETPASSPATRGMSSRGGSSSRAD